MALINKHTEEIIEAVWTAKEFIPIKWCTWKRLASKGFEIRHFVSV